MLEILAQSSDFVNDIFDTNDSELAQFLFDERVIVKRLETAATCPHVTAFEEEFSDDLEVGCSVVVGVVVKYVVVSEVGVLWWLVERWVGVFVVVSCEVVRGLWW